jgi:dTDP-glucose 4,6-dehydratase
MQTIIVAGGTGFIGSNFVRTALAQTSLRVVVFDKITYAGNPLNLEDVRDNERFEFVRGDVINQAELESLLGCWQPEAVVNFAAETHVDRSIDGPRNFLQTNVVGTFELLEAARRYYYGLTAAKREKFRFLQVSTDEVYGSLGVRQVRRVDPIRAEFAICRLESCRRSFRAFVSRDLWITRADH